jgi:2-phospho-L-lactate guanylyltransferase
MQASRRGTAFPADAGRSAHILVRAGGDVEQARAALEDRVMQPTHETTWHVVVPVKGGRTAKSRLREHLDDESLVAAIVHDTLAVVARVVSPARMVVVTSDPGEVAHAVALGAAVVADPGHGLNAACVAGVRAVRPVGAVEPVPVAVLLGDHPALCEDELRAALAAGSGLESFFVPDADGLGTALVGTTGRQEPELAFGRHSAARHTDLGHVRLDLDLPGLRHDVDDMTSLHHAAAQLTVGPLTRRALER